MDGLYEKAAIAATLDSDEVLRRVRAVCGDMDIGSPLDINADSIALRNRFGLTIEHHLGSTWCVADGCESRVPAKNNHPEDRQRAARMATLYVIAAHYLPDGIVGRHLLEIQKWMNK